MNTKEIGEYGEDCAAKYVAELGYRVLERNWRYKKAEIDLIAMDGETLIIIEVKTRSYQWYGQPEDSINTKKEAFLIDAANRYMEQINHDWELRFDIISVLIQKSGAPQIKHYQDAFFGGL